MLLLSMFSVLSVSGTAIRSFSRVLVQRLEGTAWPRIRPGAKLVGLDKTFKSCEMMMPHLFLISI